MLLGSSSNSGQIALGVRFYLNDQFTGPAKQMSSALKGYKDEFNAFQENLRAARNVALGVAAAGAAATVGMYRAAMEGAEFLYVMKGVEAITEATNVQMANLKTLAIGLGRETMFMPEDIASGMRFMAMAGQDALTIQKTMTAATNLSGATMTTLGGKMGGADIMTNALKAFGWEANRSAEMSDVLVAATTNANVSLLDLGNSIRYVAATSRNLQIPVQETIGLLMSLGNAGIQSSMAGTALENMYRYLARSLTGNASKKAREAWASMGLGRTDVTTAAGKFKPMVEILGMMNEAMKGMDPIETQAIFRQIFGVRGVRGAATIARNLEQAGGFVAMLSDEKQIGGTAAEKMKIMMDNLQGASLQLESTWKGLKVAFAEAAGKGLIPLMNGLKQVLALVTDFIKTPVGKFMSSAVFSIAAVTTVIWGIKAAILSVAYAMKTLTVSIGGMKAATGIAMGFMGMGGYNLAKAGTISTLPLMMGARGAYSNTQRSVNTGGGQSRNMRAGPGYPIGFRGNSKVNTARGGVFPIKPLTLGVKGLTSTLKKASPLLRGISMAGRGIMGFLGGPVGLGIIALTTIAPFLPDIWQALTGNTAAVEENSRKLDDKNKPINKELFAMVQGKTIEDLLSSILGNLTLAREDNLITQEALLAMIERGDPNELLQYVFSESGISVSPTFFGEQVIK